MKNHLPVLVLAIVAVLVIAGAEVYVRADSPEPPGNPPNGATQRVLFKADGISCGGCEAEIVKALRSNPAVRAVEVNLADRTVAVEYVQGAVDPKVLADAITRAGYPARAVAFGPSVPLSGKRAPGPSGGCGGGSCCAASS
jgi:copper chaperone CopZ